MPCKDCCGSRPDKNEIGHEDVRGFLSALCGHGDGFGADRPKGYHLLWRKLME